ncbi:Hypothetical protein NGAL_HAMBI2605_59130 [Neorhizobium galegae bv. orientalis]|nr:Hypothetical protein NGAL_HAMBI2605_59130 [Neorhizobium galegae bv. orientalis]
MSRISGPLKSSANAGQLSKALRGKVNIKQYYNGAIRMVGVEPVPQSGFNLLPGTVYAGAGIAGVCNQAVLRISPILSYTVIVRTGRVDIWRNDRVKVATITTGAVAAITAAMVPELTFYGEANTFGIFHRDIWDGIRLLRNPANDTLWTVSAWPYGELPEVDLGGVYVKTDDVWTMSLRWSEGIGSLAISVTVDGNTTDAVPTGGGFAAALQAAISDLPGMSSGVTVINLSNVEFFSAWRITFGGVLSGAEYQFDAQVTNTSGASALSSHTKIGKTEGEPLISAARGGFGGAALFQDRMSYFAPKARSAAIAMSRIGEYFDLNIEAQQDNAARLEALRTETSETILHMIDATYLLAFTDQNVYFASNRTVERNKPLNWVSAIEIGIKRTCRPVKLEGKVYFVSTDGGRLYSVAYDAVTEMFAPNPENDLNGADAEDLVRNIKLMWVQHKTGMMVSDRLWLLREDGRVVVCVINKSQEIMAACEWPIAGGGFVHGLSVDGQEQVWLTIERGGVITQEVAQEESMNLFQMTFEVTTDLTGQASGLAALNGKTVWAEIDGDIFGPFTVSGGVVQTEVVSRPAKIGIWIAPVYESMPYTRVLPNDDVVRRPGKVGSVRLYLENTASIAIGANGRPPRNVSLNLASDNLAAPKKNFTGHKAIAGLVGACMDPTLVISQARPGRLRVRDYIPGVKL